MNTALIKHTADALDAIRCTSPEQIARARTISDARMHALGNVVSPVRYKDDETYRHAWDMQREVMQANGKQVVGCITPPREPPPVVLGQGDFTTKWPRDACRVDVPGVFTRGGELENPNLSVE